jgi:hypothetical protein
MKAQNIDFRHWLRQIWLENCLEHDNYGELPFSIEEYFQKYKYWLKREYRHQQKKERSNNTDSNFVVDVILNDKLDYISATLLSKSQSKLIKTLKDNNEKQR